ncbi:AsmA family protein [Neisseria sp. Ec49-e6-T10]|uniref:AsmA family protein n=1 Tax=Neisseria sp. Ec49-e6-T10 TaxID=3140744 RepID=UPI003EB7C2C9
MKLKINSGRFWLRLIFFSGLFFICFTLTIQGILRWQFSEEQVKKELATLIEPTHRTISFADGMERSWLPRPAITLNNVRISEPNNPHTALTINQLKLQFSWWSLFSKTTLTKLIFNEADIKLVRFADGTVSIDDLLSLQNKARHSPQLDNLEVVSSNIDLQDQMTNNNFRLENINFALKEPHSLTGQLSASANLLFDNHKIDLNINAKVIKNKDVFQFNDFTLTAKERLIRFGQTQLKLTAQALYQPDNHAIALNNVQALLTSETPQLRLTATGQNWLLQPNLFVLPSMQIDATLKQNNIIFGWKGHLANNESSNNTFTTQSGKITTNIISPEGVITIDSTFGLKLNTQSWAYSLNQLAFNTHQIKKNLDQRYMQGSFQGTLSGQINKGFDLNVQGIFDQSKTSFSLQQNIVAEQDQYEFNLDMDHLDSTHYAVNAQTAATDTSTAFFNSEHAFDLSWLQNKQIKGNVNIQSFLFKKLQINQLTANVLATENSIGLDNLSAQIYQGKLTGKSKLTMLNNSDASLEIDQTLLGMNIQPLLTDLFGYVRLTGNGNGRLLLNATGKTPKQMRSSLSGDVSLELKNGALLGLDLVNTLQNLRSELQQNSTKMTFDPTEKTQFTQLKGNFHLIKGTARNKDLRLSSNLINIAGEGKINLDNELVEYTMHITAGKDLPRFKDINVPLKITGDITEPVYSLDYNVLTKGKNTPKEKQKVLKDELVKQLNNFIRH